MITFTAPAPDRPKSMDTCGPGRTYEARGARG